MTVHRPPHTASRSPGSALPDTPSAATRQTQLVRDTPSHARDAVRLADDDTTSPWPWWQTLIHGAQYGPHARATQSTAAAAAAHRRQAGPTSKIIRRRSETWGDCGFRISDCGLT